MSDIKRNKDAGIPGNGGKFAPDTKQTSEVPLPAVPTREEVAERQRLKGILRERISQDSLDGWPDYEDYEFDGSVKQVADAVNDSMFERLPEGVMFAHVEVTTDEAGSSYSVSARPVGKDYSITRSFDIKSATDDREATGEDSAVAIARTLEADLSRIANDAKVLATKKTTGPKNLEDVVGSLDENGFYESTIEVDLNEFLHVDAENRSDYLAHRQINNAEAYSVGYSLDEVDGDKAVVTVNNCIGEWLEQEGIEADDIEAVRGLVGR